MSINIKDVNKLAFKILLKIFNTKLYWLINFETLFSFIHFLFMLILSLGCVLINLLKKMKIPMLFDTKEQAEQ